MRNLKLLSLLGLCFLVAPYAHAQRVGVEVGVGPDYVGPAPVCPYGYYDYSPYACAPYGYYGPEWFSGGVFIGAGPWFHGGHGRAGFYGDRGNHGRMPAFSGRSEFRGGSNRSNDRAHFSGGNNRGHFSGGNSRGAVRGGGGSHSDRRR